MTHNTMLQSDLSYCEVSDVEAYLKTTIDEADQAGVAQHIKAVSRIFDRMANRILVAPAVGSGEDYPFEYYDGTARRKLLIDDCHDIQSVEVDDSELTEEDDYTAYPKNEPHYALIGSWPKGDQNIKVTARFGYFDEVPDDIRLACAIVAAGVYKGTKQGQSNIKSETIDRYSVTYTDEKGLADFKRSIGIIEMYRKIDF